MHLGKLFSTLDDAKSNFKIASFYYNEKHYSAAACFYLRCADRCTDKMRYESIIRACDCYDNLGARNYTQEILLKQCISELYKRQEGYFLICKLYEENKDWINCYTFSQLALVNCNNQKSILSEYPGIYAIKIYNAISCYHLGKIDKSFKTLIDVLQNCKVSEYFTLKVKYYLTEIIKNNI
jgi:hypothetical protein